MKIKNKIHTIEFLSCTNPNNIIIYCHGLGANKSMVTRFTDNLLSHDIGVYAFDFPGHGDDNTDFKYFNLELCIQYLDNVIDYVTQKHNNSRIYLFGSSYGAFVILNKLIKNNNKIEKTFLMGPAVNFSEIINRKMNITDDYFRHNEYLHLYNNIKLSANTYNGFALGTILVKKHKFNNIFVIQGDIDKTVYLSDVEKFCSYNNCILEVIKNGNHELDDFNTEINDFILKYMKLDK